MRGPLLVMMCVSMGCDPSSDKSDGSTCSSMDEGDERDHCYKDEVLALDASQIDEVKSRSELIQDEMIRQFAVSSWVEAHANEISLDQGRVLCDLLEGRDASYCLRRLSSPHLQR